MDLFTTVARLPYSILGHHRNDTVIADRLNYKYTVILFVIFSIVVSNKQFGSEQIVCWSPGHFVQNYVNYVNQVRIYPIIYKLNEVIFYFKIKKGVLGIKHVLCIYG